MAARLLSSVSLTDVVLLLSSVWIAVHLVLAAYNVYLHPLRRYPGPKLAAASQLLNVYHVLKGDNCKWTAQLHEKYGTVVRIGPNELSYISPSANQTIFGGRPKEDKVFEKNPVAYLQGNGDISNIFFARFHDHNRLRKLMAPAFSETAVREQEATIQGYTNQLIAALRNRSGQAAYPDAKGVVNIIPWLHFILFDVLTRLSFGDPIGCLDRADYHPWVSVIFKAIIHSTYTQAAHRLAPYQWILKHFIPNDMTANYEAHLEFTRKQLDQRQQVKEEPVARADFSSFMLKGMSPDELFDNVNIVITAGGETTASTISSSLYYLVHNPSSYERLTKEIRDTFSAEGEITLAAVAALPYLKAVIQEAMRIHPPVPIGLFRVAPAAGAFIDGQWVPGNTWVSVANLAASRSPTYWRDPERFTPERWLGDAKYESDVREASAPFSIGTRNCIGLNLANANMRIILARLLWNFDFEAQPDNTDPHELDEYGIWETKPLNLKIKERVQTT
ncbi:cytochrome P450 [Aspergillus flavus]|nr:hypothetical protein G4B11_011824 [Aspergillus flavus]RAQ56916.1 cytochrome P450 [Aspergillus flavus]RAQ58165.1 cytochrome P450 [Aspergillus flavus]